MLLLCFFTGAAWAQFTVTGTVLDENTGEPLIGANIFHEASGRGTTTDLDGMFTLELPGQSATLRSTYIGYISKNVEVTSDDTEIEIMLSPDVAKLEEVVVTGLGTSVKRENLANAVSKIDADELTERVSPQTLDGALYGKLAGVSIRSQSGAPGGGINVQLRGISTLGAGNSQPLYIIDGVYVDNSNISNGRFRTTGANAPNEDNAANRLADLNPDEIESVEILKGPSAAAIYGQRANAGVVIITTKRGDAGDTQISVDQGIGFVSGINFIGTAEWDEEKIDFYDAVFGLPTSAANEKQKLADARAAGRIVDWEEQVYGREGLVSETQLSVSGGDAKTRFYVSAALRDEEGIIENTGFNRGSVRANLDHFISDRLKVSSSSNFIKTDNQRGFTGNQNGTGGSVGYALSTIPTYANLFPNAEGEFPNNPYFDDNPLAIVEHATNDEDITRFIQSLDVNADLIVSGPSKLSLNLKGGFDFLNFKSLVHMPAFLQHQQANANPGAVVRTTQGNLNTNLQALLIFTSDVGSGIGDINLTTQVGFSRFDQDQDREQLLGRGLTPGQNSIGQATVQSVTNQAEQEIVDTGFFGQQEVNLEDKLILTFGARFDRSTLNLDQDKYYFYPKASLAANLTNMNFWQSDLFNQFKLRFAFGQTGGLPTFGSTFIPLNGNNIGGNLGLTAPTNGIDPDLEPERATEFEGGLDVTVFEGRIAFEGTYYNKTVDDLILNLPTPTSTGVNRIATNAAELENRGWEFGLTVAPVRNENLNWLSKILWWTNESEITKLNIPATTAGGFGTSLGSFVIQEGFSPTTIVGNPAVDGPSLFTEYGDAEADFQMSFNNTVDFFKNFQFSSVVHWKKGGDNINLTQLLTDLGGTTEDWNEGISEGNSPALDRLGGIPGTYIQDATYVKIRELSLYYNVPLSFLQNNLTDRLRRVRLGISANNVLIFSPYDSYDPEVSVFGTQPINNAVEVTPFPTSRRIMFNVELDF